MQKIFGYLGRGVPIIVGRVRGHAVCNQSSQFQRGGSPSKMERVQLDSLTVFKLSSLKIRSFQVMWKEGDIRS